MSSGTFTLSDGVITGNSASSYGGGVYMDSGGTFTKQFGGTIYGSDGGSLQNSASDGSTAYTSRGYYRNSTAGVGVTLDSRTSGRAWGWE